MIAKSLAAGQTTDVHAGFAMADIFNALKSNDVMHHRVVYPLLGGLLKEHRQAVNVLDLGCGDAAEICQVIRELPVAGYTGIDSSRSALELAEDNLQVLQCPVRLLHGDYTMAWDLPEQTFSVVWLGLFLHHVPSVAKIGFLGNLNKLLAPGGILLAHDPLLQEMEDRASYIARLEGFGRERWHFLNKEQLHLAGAHWRKHGHQEPYSVLDAQGAAAGFSNSCLLWTDPEGFYGLILFSKGGKLA